MTTDDASEIHAAEVAFAEALARFESLIDQADDDELIRAHVSDSMPDALERLAGKLRASVG